MSPRGSGEAMLRVADVLDRVGVSRRTLCRWRADGTFPQALQLGANSIGWPSRVVDEWLASRACCWPVKSSNPRHPTVRGRTICPRRDSGARRRLSQHHFAAAAAFAGLWWGGVALSELGVHAAVVGVGWLAGGGRVGVGIGRVNAAVRGARKGGVMTDVKLRSGSGLSDASRGTPVGASVAADTWALADAWGLSESLRRRLVEVYGRAPRRLSHRSALSLGGVALMAGVTVSAPGALHGRARRLGWRHVAESPATLLVAATGAGDDTWMSTPVRALLECAQHARWVCGVDEIIAQALSKTPQLFDPEELATVAADLRFAAGLRRIASVADALTAVAADSDNAIPQHARSMVAVDCAYAALCERAASGERWLGLDPNVPQHTAVMLDRRRRVWWHTTPAELAEHLLY